jgi:hypothetical protein
VLETTAKSERHLECLEIEPAIFALAEQLFDAQEIPFGFLQAFGNKRRPSSACARARPTGQSWEASPDKHIRISRRPTDNS